MIVLARMAVLCVVLLAATAQAADVSFAAGITYRCTNPASGANWTIAVDLDRKTADTYPAAISDRQITWQNPDDAGNYSLDRKTGKLTVVRASSTGGYMIFDRCEPAR